MAIGRAMYRQSLDMPILPDVSLCQVKDAISMPGRHISASSEVIVEMEDVAHYSKLCDQTGGRQALTGLYSYQSPTASSPG
nr:hypothetical protein CFP56_74885 [Quercus suber]